MQSTSAVWILSMTVALFLSMPAMAHVLNASLEMTSVGYQENKISVGKLHRCTSLSSDVCNEATVGAFTKRRNPSIYSAAHSKIGEYHRGQHKSKDKHLSQPIQLRDTKQSDGEYTGSGDPSMYTRIQTQLFPHIRF